MPPRRPRGGAPGTGALAADQRRSVLTRRSCSGSVRLQGRDQPRPVARRPCRAWSSRSRAERPRSGQGHQLVAEPGAARPAPVDRRARATRPCRAKAAAERAARPAPAEAEAEPYRERGWSCGRGSRSAGGPGRPGGCGRSGQRARRRTRGARRPDSTQHRRRGLRARRRPRRSARSSASKDAGKAAQCSRSAARRSFSPNRAQRAAALAPAQRRVPRLRVVDEVRQQPGQRGADQEVVVASRAPSRACSRSQRRLARVEHRALVLVQDAGGPGVDHQQPHPAEVAPVAPARPTRGRRRRGRRRRAAASVPSGRLAHRRVQRVGGQLGGGEVAQVLVDPVRHQAARGSARATTAWPASRPARPRWCSSRR